MTPPAQLRQETLLAAACALILALAALAYCAGHGMLLLYGDAVAHLHIARRLTDSLYPGWRQLGSVWLPLPHLLVAPFASSMRLWQTGLAGAPPSMAAYTLACAGLYRLLRLALPPAASVLGALAFALNPGLLYLSTTAMTEPIFLAEMVWAAVFVTEHALLAAQTPSTARERQLARKLLGAALVLACAVFTRYDGWVYAALAWCLLVWHSLRYKLHLRWAFFTATVIIAAAPAVWLWYNAHLFGDSLDFLRGPYSAKAIEARTGAHGPGHYPGWHRWPVALLYYAKVAELGAVSHWLANLLLLAALAGAALAVKKGLGAAAALFWLPILFYTYSVAYGSVPIFFPFWYPHGWYNTRYGMEMLPAFALGLAFLAAAGLAWVSKNRPELALPSAYAAAALLGLNTWQQLRAGPLVYQEAVHNSLTRIPFERTLAHALTDLGPAGLILMNAADHVGAVQQAGIPLERVINDADWDLWRRGLADPAHSARWMVALDGDAVARAVAAHPEGLQLRNVICSTGQPCARLYESTERRSF